MPDRIQAIRQLLENNPEDVFLHYSLGMELARAERIDEAMERFDECIDLDPAYLPARIERARALRATGQLAEARQAFADALAAARQAGDTHAADAVRQQLDSLPPTS
jgi:tetratricopeptide (TPR) repeat protein